MVEFYSRDRVRVDGKKEDPEAGVHEEYLIV